MNSSRLPTRPLGILCLALLLVFAALSLITAQHRARGLFVELGRAQAQSRELEHDGARLKIELGRAAQPAAVAQSARALGLRPTEGAQTVFVPGAGIAEQPAVAVLKGASRR